MYYHASQISNLKKLNPNISNHGVPLIYFSNKRENVLVYLSNSVEKFCKETGFSHKGSYSKWGPYSFTKEGIIQIEEYYPNALYETYKGVSGYIYSVKENKNIKIFDEIPNVFISDKQVEIENTEYIEDAYDELIKEEKKGNIKIVKFEDFIKTKKDWLEKTIKKEYLNSKDQPEYRYFLENKFSYLIDFLKVTN